MNLILKLYACCIPVKGFARSVICDLQQMRYDFIPNALFEILSTHRSLTIEEIKSFYQHEYDEIIDEYIELLLKKDYGFLCNPEDAERFPDLLLHWQSPGLITNSILDIPASDNYDYVSVAEQLNFLGCEAVQLRFFYQPEWESIKNVLNAFSRSRIRHIDILMAYDENVTEKMFQDLFEAYPRVYFVTLFNSPLTEIVDHPASAFCIHYLQKKIMGPSDCGCINPSFFVPNTRFFTESKHFNNCLNKKISIDQEGHIRNCPSHKESFGNIRDIRLDEALNKEGFRKFWNVNKDSIEVCKDCEFRYVCTDCRVFVSDSHNPLSKPAKCNYDPYTATWA